MRKVICAFSVSLDGFIEAADGDIAWSYPDEELHNHFNVRESAIDLYLYGRRLYEDMAAFWPTAGENPAAPEIEKEYARIWKPKPKVVFSTTLKQVGWNARLVKGNIADEVHKLKEQPGRDMTVGGAGLASTFTQLGLIDEFWLYVHPVVLGDGKPMFPKPGGRLNLQLIETRRFGRGIVLLRYQRPGAGER
jgi:dihydrofolate reductase